MGTHLGSAPLEAVHDIQPLARHRRVQTPLKVAKVPVALHAFAHYNILHAVRDRLVRRLAAASLGRLDRVVLGLLLGLLLGGGGSGSRLLLLVCHLVRRHVVMGCHGLGRRRAVVVVVLSGAQRHWRASVLQ